MFFSAFLERALRRAAIAHQGQTRKATEVPYITHPVQVAWILARAGFTDETLLAAALLHDVVEDCGVSLDDLAREFSPAVADIVAGLSERKLDDAGRKRPWEDRKREHLGEIASATRAVRAVTLADKLHNLETIAVDLAAGADVWSRFSAPPERLLWYYRQMIELCAAGDASLESLAADGLSALDRISAAAPHKLQVDSVLRRQRPGPADPANCRGSGPGSS